MFFEFGALNVLLYTSGINGHDYAQRQYGSPIMLPIGIGLMALGLCILIIDCKINY